jgi:predicted MFS family arabinose efflux permease
MMLSVAHYSREDNRTRSYSLNRLAVNLGWAVGGAIGGFIASKNYHLLFWIDGLTNIGAAFLLRSVLSPSRNSLTPHKRDPSLKTRTNSAYRDKRYMLFVVLTILYGCMFFQTFATMPVFYTVALHLTPVAIGMVMALNGLIITLFEMTLIFKLESRKHIIHYITIGVLLVGASFVAYNILPGQHMLALFSTVVLTFGEMLSMPFMNTYWVGRTNDSNRGQYAGMYTVAWSTAQVVGPFAGSQVAQHYSFYTLWWIVGSISIVAAIGFKYLQSKN